MRSFSRVDTDPRGYTKNFWFDTGQALRIHRIGLHGTTLAYTPRPVRARGRCRPSQTRSMTGTVVMLRPATSPNAVVKNRVPHHSWWSSFEGREMFSAREAYAVVRRSCRVSRYYGGPGRIAGDLPETSPATVALVTPSPTL